MFRQSENFAEAQRATLGRASGAARTRLGSRVLGFVYTF